MLGDNTSSEAGQPSFVLTRRLADGTVEWTPIEVAQRVAAVPHADYALIDRTLYEAPQTLVARRVGDDLIIEAQGSEVLVLDGFFVTEDVAFYPTTDIAGGAGPFSGTPLTPGTPVQAGSPEQVVWAAEGSAREQVAEAGADGAGTAGSPLLWGGLAAGGLGLALAAGGGGGGGSSGGDGGGGDAGIGDGGDGGNGSAPDITPPEITSGDTATAIPENSGAGQVVYTATATDESAVTWSLGGGDAALFSIDPETGEVTLTVNPDYESQSSYTFTVIATDAAGNRAELTIGLSIEDQDDTAPFITSGARAEAIDENSGADQVIYTATATDDNGEVSWSLHPGRDGRSFTIDATTGAVTLTADPDYETQSSYVFTVIATDSDGNSSRQMVTLAINNLDEVAPTITSGDTATPIDENSGAGQVVYTVTSTDDGDISTGSTTYSLAPADDAERFSIDPDSGEVTLLDDPDYETLPSYSFTVVATDAAGNSSQQSVTLAINDLPDGPSVLEVALSGSGVQNGLLNEGDTVTVTVTMSDNVTVDTSGGTPRIVFAIGGVMVYADYVSGSGSDRLAFEYTIQAGENDSSGISMPADALEPNGGTLTDAAGQPARLGHGAVADQPGLMVDTTAPTLTSHSLEDDAGNVPVDADIVLTFSENVVAGSGNITISNGSDTRTIDVTDSSQVSISGDQVTIDPTDDLDGRTMYDVQIDAGAITDEAGNALSAAITFEFETAIDETVVVFDLIEGVSSSHSGRTFNPDVSYDIYILVESDDEDLETDGDDTGTWGIWSGAEFLGSDDRIILVGDGSNVLGPDTFWVPPLPVNGVSVGSTAIAWDTPFGAAAVLHNDGTITRSYDDDTETARLFDGQPSDFEAFFAGQGGDIGTMYMTELPEGILTSQGLA